MAEGREAQARECAVTVRAMDRARSALPSGDAYGERLDETMERLEAEKAEGLGAEEAGGKGPLAALAARQIVEAAGAVHAGWRLNARQCEEQPDFPDPRRAEPFSRLTLTP